MFVFQGTFEVPKAAVARSVFYRTIYSTIYTSEPDPRAAIQGIEQSVALDSSCFFVHLELGNQYLKIGDRENALRVYRVAWERSPHSDSISDLLAQQIQRLEGDEPLETIAPLRNPGIE
jgi:predicted Zn-dependent protease